MNLKHAPLSDAPHQILLSPKLTTFIIIDHQMAFEACFDIKAIKVAEKGVVNLAVIAGEIDIPIITSLVKTNLIGPTLSLPLENRIPKMTRYNRNAVNPWDDPAFADAVQAANRPRLLIAGLSAETSLSFTALCALERGYDVYVVKDACLGHSEQSFATTFDRLTQAGVVPVSWRQVMLEWSQGSVDAGMLRRILRARRMLKSSANMPKGQS